jgi:transcriptional regulator with XRE-family HTH domain
MRSVRPGVFLSMFAVSGRARRRPTRPCGAGYGEITVRSGAVGPKGVMMPVLRQVVGETLRGLRMRQRRTLREVSATARVSLGYLSEVERGQKEPSSELLAAICAALEVELSDLFAEVSQTLRREEKLALSNRVALVGAGSARISAAPVGDPRGTAQVRALPTVAA